MRGSIPIVLVALATLWLPPGSRAAQPLTLDDLLKAALAHDGRVLAAHAQLDVYRAKYERASWLWFPQAKLSVLFGGPVGERKLADPGDPNSVRLTKTTHWSLGDLSGEVSFAVGGKIEAAMPLYTFGKLSGAKDAAQAGIRGGEAGILKARQAVALEVRRAYYGWLLAASTVDILEDGEKKLKNAEKKLIKLLDELNEDVTDRDLFKLRYHAAQVKSMLVQARQGKLLALSALAFLTGIEGLDEEGKLSEAELKAEPGKVKKREEYLAQARTLRPELQQLSAAGDALQASVEIEKASFLPDFFISGYFSGSYSPAHDLIKNSLLNRGLTYYDTGLSLGLRMTLDIPQKLARLREARAALKKIRTQARQAESAVGFEIDRRLGQISSAADNLKILKKGRRAAKAWMRANFMSYGVGIADTKDLLDSLAAYAKAQIELNGAHHDTMVLLDQLNSAVGVDLGSAP